MILFGFEPKVDGRERKRRATKKHKATLFSSNPKHDEETQPVVSRAKESVMGPVVTEWQAGVSPEVKSIVSFWDRELWKQRHRTKKRINLKM